MTDSFKCLVAGTLNLEGPWYIEGIETDVEKMQVPIYVNIRAGLDLPALNAAAKQPCATGTSRMSAYGGQAMRMFCPTFVHCRRPRVRCPFCGTKLVRSSF